jgi:nitrite reductase/ring-hydroxylating ferredoxin subunit
VSPVRLARRRSSTPSSARCASCGWKRTVRAASSCCAGEAVLACWNEGPHRGDRSLLECGFHDARFRLDDGLCVAGPCLGHALTRFPVALADGEVRAA